MNNTYTLTIPGTFEWLRTMTEEGGLWFVVIFPPRHSLFLTFDFVVPDEVDEISVIPSGVTCINVSWSGPTNIYGPPENRAYFLTYRGESIDHTMDVGTDTFVALDNLTADVSYRFEV